MAEMQISRSKMARQLPLDEKNPRKAGSFVRPFKGGFAEHDTPTLAGKVALSIYDNFVKRPDGEECNNSQEAQRRVQMNRQAMERFRERVAGLNEARRERGTSPLHLTAEPKAGEDGFHHDGKAHYDGFPYHFKKASRNWSTADENQVRLYVTIDKRHAVQNATHFAELASRLYDAGIDFTAKASNPHVVLTRMDNMVFYVSDAHQGQAIHIIRNYLVKHRLGSGNLPYSYGDYGPGLSAAREPGQRQNRAWNEISGSTKGLSHNLFLAMMATPDYLRRLADAHQKAGNGMESETFLKEAQRTDAIVKKYWPTA